MEHHQTYLSLATCMAESLHLSSSFLLKIFGQGWTKGWENFSLFFFLVFGKHEDEKRMNKIPPFLFFSSRQWGGQTLHTHFFSFVFHFFITHTPYFILPLTKHVSWHVLPIIPCHGRPLLIRGGNLTCKSPPLSTCTNRSSHIDLSHFWIFSHKSYWLNSHEINQIEAWNFHTFLITYSRQ